MRVVVGGTFDFLHVGHQQLLTEAFCVAGEEGEVFIGLSSDEFAANKRHPVRPYAVRRAELVLWIVERGFTARYVIEPLYDVFGPALVLDFDVLVVGYDTISGGRRINERRRAAGIAEVRLLVVSCIVAADGREVSTSRICQGEIDRFGNTRGGLGLRK